MAEFDPERLDPTGTPRPPYVTTEAERQRWDLCVLIAREIVDLHEGPGENAAMRWQMVRSIYQSDMETGDPAEAAEVLREALEQTTTTCHRPSRAHPVAG